jgi:hypothetical protein
MSVTKKYLSSEEIQLILGDIIIDNSFIPMSQDTYNETAIVQAIAETSKQPALAMAAINMSCIGYGNKRYGQFKYKDQIIDIATLLKDCNVKINLGRDAKLMENDLTPQRICRAFRNHTRDYIIKTRFETYLFRKYSNHDIKFMHICFRGAEYLDDLTAEEVSYMLDLYAKVDTERNTNILERIRRIFQAKGYLSRNLNF